MYLARMVSCGLCLSSHFSRFFILRGRVKGMKSGSSPSGGVVSPSVEAAAATALSWGGRLPVPGSAGWLDSAMPSRGGPWGATEGVVAGSEPAVETVDGFLEREGRASL